MSNNQLLLGRVESVEDIKRGKLVRLKIKSANIKLLDSKRDPTDIRARARALIAAGIREEGFIRKPNLAVEAPDMERKTKIISKEKIDNNVFRYIIRIEPGLIL